MHPLYDYGYCIDSETLKALESYYDRRIYHVRKLYDSNGLELMDELGGTLIVDLYLVEKIVYDFRKSRVRNAYDSEYYDYSNVVNAQQAYNHFQNQQVKVYPPLPKQNKEKPEKKICECGENCSEKRDHHGWCDGRAKKFWQKVNKIYWSRNNKI